MLGYSPTTESTGHSNQIAMTTWFQKHPVYNHDNAQNTKILELWNLNLKSTMYIVRSNNIEHY